MPVRSNLPVVFLACVNSYEDGKRLRHLTHERKLISKILTSYQKPNLFHPVQKGNLSNAYFFNHLDEHEYQERVSILHLVGHADSDHLRIESENFEVPIHVDELSRMLALMPNLKAVFLSGCATPKILEALLRRDIPAIFVTETHEKTVRSMGIARTFYQAIAKGFSLKKSFAAAQKKYPELKAHKVSYNVDKDSFNWRGKKTAAFREEMSWGMYYLEENEGIIGRNFHSNPLVPFTRGIGSESARRLKRRMRYLTYTAAAIALALLMVGAQKYFQSVESVQPFLLSLMN